MKINGIRFQVKELKRKNWGKQREYRKRIQISEISEIKNKREITKSKNLIILNNKTNNSEKNN